MRFTRLIAVLVPGVWFGTANAAPITYDSYSLLNAQHVTLSDSVHGINEAALAGRITLQGGNLPGGSLDVFCVDIPDTLRQPGSFPTTGTLAGAFGAMVNALISHVSPTLTGVQYASAALQIAIWKVEYGPSLTVTTPDDPAITTLADSYVANLSGAAPTWLADRRFQVSTFLGLRGNQDQAFLTAVPEPASLALLAAGLGMAGIGTGRLGSGRLARRMRRASTGSAVSVAPVP